jgi:hypothetical protein
MGLRVAAGRRNFEAGSAKTRRLRYKFLAFGKALH